jgi:hypothetical protein
MSAAIFIAQSQKRRANQPVRSFKEAGSEPLPRSNLAALVQMQMTVSPKIGSTLEVEETPSQRDGHGVRSVAGF